MKYPICAILLLTAIRLPAQPSHQGKRLITGVLRDSAHAHLSGTLYIGDSLRRAQREMLRQMYALERAQTAGNAGQVAALAPAWEQWRVRSLAVMHLGRDSAYEVHPNGRTGRFRLWARPTDTIYVESEHHFPQRYRVADLPRRGRNLTLVLRAEPCVPYVACFDTTGREYAFIGRKIRLERAPEPYYCDEPAAPQLRFYTEYTATYCLLQQLRGHYPSDTLTFSAYDHYGWPPFRPYVDVLVFVQEYCGRPIYQRSFYPVYRTTDGRWAAPYNWLDHQNPALEPPIKPRLISFAEPVSIDVSGVAPEYLPQRYPAPYYCLENGQALAVYGNYVDEILENRQRLQAPQRALYRRLEAELRAKTPPAQPPRPQP